jgi:hypothetical protein
MEVAGSISDGVVGITHWFNHSGRAMAVGLTQPPTDISEGKVNEFPLQALTGPEDSRRLRLPDFKTVGTW